MFWRGVWASTSLVILLMQCVPGSTRFLRHESKNAKAWPWTKDEHGHDADTRQMYDPKYRQPKEKHQPARSDRATGRVEESGPPRTQATHARPNRNASQVPEPPQSKAVEETELIPKPLKSASVETVTTNRDNGTDSFGSHVSHEPTANVTLSNSTKAVATKKRNASQVPELPQPKALEETEFVPKPLKSALAGRKPRVHFLFLAVDKISNMKVWKAFFQDAPPSLFRAYVHCKTYACETSVERSFSALRKVPSVNGQYCTDLVSPMISLLSHALDVDEDGAHPYDKFVFVSDSTLPAKSFHQVYDTLSERDGSDFCVFPAGEWADRSSGDEMELVPKHHQWVTLELAHAEKLVRLWRDGSMRRLMTSFHMNWHSYKWNNNSYGDQRNFGCLDEFWFMGALYGTIKVGEHASKSVWLDGFANGPLRVDSDAAWQGTCDTFVNWEQHLHAGYRNPFEAFHDQLDHLSEPHSGNSARPGWWDRMTPTGLRAIKASDFLFVRKFIDAPELANGQHGQTFAEAFIDIVLK